eukprot:m.130982 g.130982  ORF g.130982 m.130982 type:complete len:344 (+) comp13739_c0_seq1:140-1171(+)
MEKPFLSMPSLLPNLNDWPRFEELAADCRAAYAEQQEHGKSFWLSVNDAATPASGLEALAAAVLRLHRDRAGGAAVVGVEWWTQVRGPSSAEGNAIGFHWDRDEVLADEAVPELVHPRVATVTYLTGNGAPTVVVDQTPLLAPGTAVASQGFVSHPAAGKHIAFGGGLLHGVPPELMLPAAGGAKPPRDHRFTFLANIWAGSPPSGITRMTPAISASLSLRPADLTPLIAPAPAIVPPREAAGDQDAVCGFAFGREGDEEHELWLPLVRGKCRRGESVSVRFGEVGATVTRRPPVAKGGGGHPRGGDVDAPRKKRKKKNKKKNKSGGVGGGGSQAGATGEEAA